MDSGRIMKELRELQEGVKNVSIQIGSLDKSGKNLDQHRKKAKKTENYKLKKTSSSLKQCQSDAYLYLCCIIFNCGQSI